MLLSWGSNVHGECCSGDNGETVQKRPQCVNGVLHRSLGYAPSVTAVASGKSYSLLLMANGDVFACGRGKEGQLGIDLTTGCSGVRQPKLISGLQPWRISQIACGCNHSMAVSCCGKAFEWGLLLDEDLTKCDDSVASRVGGMGRDFKEDLNEKDRRIVAESWSRYVMNSPTEGESGLQGDDAIALFQTQSCQRYRIRTPRQCTGLEDVHVHKMACGYGHSVALLNDGMIMAHGYNEKGQVGNGVRLPSQHFVRVAPPAETDGAYRANTLACGLNHNAALLSDGQLLTWGLGTFGQLGLGQQKKECCRPGVVKLNAHVVGVACGDNHTVVLHQGGDVFAFGHRDALGGSSHEQRLPERVRTLRPGAVEQVFAGGNGSFALMKDDDVGVPMVLHSWGYNQKFQLGRYTGERDLVFPGPTCLPRLSGMHLQSLDAGMYHCLSLHNAPTAPILPQGFHECCLGSAALWIMLKGDVEYDVSIRVGTDTLGAHYCVLRARCPELAARLQKVSISGQAKTPCHWDLSLNTYHNSTIKCFLEYIYCDYCRATADVAANLKAIADEFSLPRLAAGVAAASQTESCGSGVCWVRTAEGKWAQMADDAAQRNAPSVASSYTADLLQLVLVDDNVTDNLADFLPLRVKQIDGTRVRATSVARPLLLTSVFFRALLDGGFAESHHLSASTEHLEISADNADAFVLCLQMLATGNAGALMPASSEEILAVMVEAHRIGFPDALSASETALGNAIAGGNLDAERLEAIASIAHLYDMERLAQEATLKLHAEA